MEVSFRKEGHIRNYVTPSKTIFIRVSFILLAGYSLHLVRGSWPPAQFAYSSPWVTTCRWFFAPLDIESESLF